MAASVDPCGQGEDRGAITLAFWVAVQVALWLRRGCIVVGVSLGAKKRPTVCGFRWCDFKGRVRNRSIVVGNIQACEPPTVEKLMRTPCQISPLSIPRQVEAIEASQRKELGGFTVGREWYPWKLSRPCVANHWMPFFCKVDSNLMLPASQDGHLKG